MRLICWSSPAGWRPTHLCGPVWPEQLGQGDFELVAPPVRLCSDNAVMVAWAGVERLRLGWSDGIDVNARPRWPLEALEAVAG